MNVTELAIHVKMPADKRKELKLLADSQGMSISSFVRSILYKQIENSKA